jgi:hypothetical protein
VDREARLRLSIETGRVGISVCDATGSVHTLDWSRRLKEIFGLSAGDNKKGRVYTKDKSILPND